MDCIVFLLIVGIILVGGVLGWKYWKDKQPKRKREKSGGKRDWGFILAILILGTISYFGSGGGPLLTSGLPALIAAFVWCVICKVIWDKASR